MNFPTLVTQQMNVNPNQRIYIEPTTNNAYPLYNRIAPQVVYHQPQVVHQVMQQPVVHHQVVQQPYVQHQVVQQPYVHHQVVQQPFVQHQVVQQPQIMHHQVVQQPQVMHQVVNPMPMHQPRVFTAFNSRTFGIIAAIIAILAAITFCPILVIL